MRAIVSDCRPGVCVKYFLVFPWQKKQKTLTRETDTKKLRNFKKLLLLRNAEFTVTNCWIFIMCLHYVGLNPVCVWKDEVCTEIDHGGLTGFERTLRPLCKQEQTVSIDIY